MVASSSYEAMVRGPAGAAPESRQGNAMTQGQSSGGSDFPGSAIYLQSYRLPRRLIEHVTREQPADLDTPRTHVATRDRRGECSLQAGHGCEWPPSAPPLAGLWEGWRGADGEVVRSFAVITTQANAVARQVHTRMPVVLEAADWPLWLARRPPSCARRPTR